MKVEITTHNEILEDPIIELEKTIDNPNNETFMPLIILVDKDDSRRRFAQYLPPQPYINGTWTDGDVDNAINVYLNSMNLDVSSERSSINKSSNVIKDEIVATKVSEKRNWFMRFLVSLKIIK